MQVPEPERPHMPNSFGFSISTVALLWIWLPGPVARFGRGNHAAGLKFGDCLTYALPDVAREPQLFKGIDFTLTDVQVA